MNFSIIPLYTGKRAKIYTIRLDDDELSEYEKFIFDNINSESTRLLDAKLKRMAYNSGFINEFFKRESSEAYSVFRIADTKNLRLFCIRYSGVAIIVGGGGEKLPGTRKLSENPKLEEKVNFLVDIEKMIETRIRSKEIIITNTSIEGNLTFEE